MSYRYLLQKNVSSFKRWSFCTKSRFLSSAPASASLKHLTNSNVLGYYVKEVEDIPELNLTAIHLEHTKTGAEHLHLACKDPNNFFGVTFKTLPPNDTGVVHILEHLSLCGSKRFPCRDPFFNMMNRSLATYMNAFTGPDFTTYAFSSQNRRDFENLLHVYLDAVFYPNLTEKDFRQEGWRLEHENIHDQSSPIIFKGVVFNEMKGVLADSSVYFSEKLLNHMFPSNAYQYVYGGDPLSIPQLSLEELRGYHSMLYHPSNSRFITYGNMPLEPHLETIETLVLNNFDKNKFYNEVSNIESVNKEVKFNFRFDPMAAKPDKQTVICESFLLSETKNTYENFALSVMGTLLVDGPNALLYQNLLQSGIGSDYSPFTGFLGYLKQSIFSVGLREIAEKDVEEVKNIIKTTLEQASQTGFSKNQIDGVLHNLELSTKHQTSNFGLNCCVGVNTVWNHGGNPVTAFRINDHIRWLSEKLQPGNKYFEDMIHKYLVQNPNKLTLIMTPVENYEAENVEKEKQLLDSKLKCLTDAEKSEVYQQGLDLAEHQKIKDVSCLPTLHLDEVAKNIEPTLLEFATKCGVSVQCCKQPTNGVVYFRAAIDTSCVPAESLVHLPLLCIILTQMGAGIRDYKKFDEEAQLKSGSLNVSFDVSEDPTDPTKFSQNIIVASRCLERNLDDMLSLWTDVLNNAHFSDVERFSQLVLQNAAEASQGVSLSGHSYAMRRAAASLTPAALIKEETSGITQVTHLKQLAEMEDHSELLLKMKELAEILFKNLNKNQFKCSINATPDFMQSALSSIESSFLKKLSYSSDITSKASNTKDLKALEHKNCHFVLPVPVNFVGQSILTVPYNNKDFASLKVVAKLMSSKFLHTEIREKGGAYGGGASLNGAGHFFFYSYRDPNFEKTLSSFESSIDWAVSSQYSDEDIDEAKLRIFGELDAPVPPGSKGSAFFLSGISDKMRAALRTALFDCKRTDLIAACNRYLKNPPSKGMALFGPENKTTSAQDSGWTVTRSTM